MEVKNINYRTKQTPKKLPEGAEIMEKRITIDVEEIENGFLLTKEITIEYLLGDEMNYMYKTKKTYSKVNPVEGLDVNINNEEEESLADKF